jgi:hypothetical protein
MENVYPMAEYDVRINGVCDEALPSHPHVAKFLAGALRANGGSWLVARMLCDYLDGMQMRSEASEGRVETFSVILLEEARGETVSAYLRRHDDLYMDALTDLTFDLRGRMERAELIANMKGSVPRLRPCKAIKDGEEAKDVFMNIFSIAYAMLSEAPIELVTMAAA